jgi:hypothetical protein
MCLKVAKFSADFASDQDGITEKIDEIKIACSPKNRHSNCAESFYNLCKNNIEKAKKIAKEAHIYLVEHRMDNDYPFGNCLINS